ncbi:MAG: hypothetical protein KAT48_00760 [Bacteroidales bacterium]|nr:hypothetical protein [Bacteroidales bacterium]
MMNADQLISSIELKIRNLIEQQKSIKEENNYLKQQKEKITKTLEVQKSMITDLENKYRILKVSKALEINTGSKDVKKKITELVREIDKCISLLNK